MSHHAPDDDLWYLRCTGPQQIAKALNVLEGLLEGVDADATIDARELRLLRSWMHEHDSLAKKQPFYSVHKALQAALSDGVLTEEERSDLIWLCQQARADAPFFNHLTCQMQVLHGMLRGIAVDEVISKAELQALSSWMAEHSELECMWPYAELFTLICTVLSDGRIDAQEHELLLAFFNNFSGDGTQAQRLTGQVPISLTGICITGCDITFPDKSFCFTGAGRVHTRNTLAALVEKRGGMHAQRVTQSLDYLVVCDNGNKTWAFSAYGRKVEQAMHHRKCGINISLVRESDFHDALVE